LGPDWPPYGDARIIVLHNESVESELVHSLVPDRLAVNTEAMLKELDHSHALLDEPT